MKFFLAILTIVLVAQVSLGASIQRSKRDADIDVITTFKEFFHEATPVFANVVKETPDDDTYAVYKQQYVEILEFLNEMGDDVCLQNVAAFFLKTDKITEDAQGGSKEAAEIWELYLKSVTPKFLRILLNVGHILDDEDNIDQFELCETD